mmetsp:Transcript_987/g.2130  ORF Transcript_987/g.2130 Transcript_987/m.2130 type:complete len:406 (-) Transcript_987:77-1294(-)
MFDNVFAKGKEKLSNQMRTHASYDGKPDPTVPLRLMQHTAAPCWQVHAYLRFINQPYWTENINFEVAMGVDVPVLVDRQYVMSAQPAIRCIEEVAANAVSGCDSSFIRYNTVVRLLGLWSLLEARRDTDTLANARISSTMGIQYLSRVYANVKKHFLLASSTPAYLSSTDLQKAADSCYKLISEQWLDIAMADRIYLSGTMEPGLADSVLFAHLVEVAMSKTDRRGLARIQQEYPNLFTYFVHICEEYFHIRNGVAHTELKLQGNSALYQCVVASHGAESQDALSAIAESVTVKLIFGENDDSEPLSPGAVKRPLGEKGCHLVPHLNQPCQFNSIQLLKSKYSFDIPGTLRSFFGSNVSGERGKGTGENRVVTPPERYIGVRCLLFTSFIVGSFAKACFNISENM